MHQRCFEPARRPRSRPVALILLAILCFWGCDSSPIGERDAGVTDGGFPEGPGSASGSVADAGLSVRDATWASPPFPGEIAIVVSGESDRCSISTISHPELRIDVYGTYDGGFAAVAEGKYPVLTELELRLGVTPSHQSLVRFTDPNILAYATDGAVQLVELPAEDGGFVRGTFDLQFAQGHISGYFNARICGP